MVYLHLQEWSTSSSRNALIVYTEMIWCTLLLVRTPSAGIDISSASLLARTRQYLSHVAWSIQTGKFDHWLNGWTIFILVHGCWLRPYQSMRWQSVSKICIETRRGLPTRQKAMVSNVMLYVTMGSPIKSTSGTIMLQRSTWRLECALYIQGS